MNKIIMAVSESNLKGDVKGEIFGLMQELGQLRRSQMQPAVKYLGVTAEEQYEHLRSEIIEVDREWWKKDFPKMIEEIIDLQFSCQTMLEGPLKQTKSQIADAIQKVVEKNRVRDYDKPPVI